MKKIPLDLHIKKSRIRMSPEELRKYYQTIKGSARISENKKAYKRSRDKKISD